MYGHDVRGSCLFFGVWCLLIMLHGWGCRPTQATPPNLHAAHPRATGVQGLQRLPHQLRRVQPQPPLRRQHLGREAAGGCVAGWHMQMRQIRIAMPWMPRTHRLRPVSVQRTYPSKVVIMQGYQVP